MVRPEGVEPPTYWFVASCSIQLSYGRTLQRGNSVRIPDPGLWSKPIRGFTWRWLVWSWARPATDRESSTRVPPTQAPYDEEGHESPLL